MNSHPIGQASHWLKRKNRCVPDMGLVTVSSPPITTGPVETLVHTAAESRFVVNCKKKLSLAGHDSTTFGPDGVMVNCGGASPSQMLKTVPLPLVPFQTVVPYKVLLDRTIFAGGGGPSTSLKLC